MTGAGDVHTRHPVVAAYVGDYPEQILVGAVPSMTCPSNCKTKRDKLGLPQVGPLHQLEKILDALALLDEGPTILKHACADAGIKPVVHPFWEKLPFLNIYCSLTPDILHQLYQGVKKHLKEWPLNVFGKA